jgi:general secretion pathway protein I
VAASKSRVRRATVQRALLRSRGFTLVEVLAALVIISLGMLGVIEAVSQTANNGAYLRERTIAHWIAMNRVTQVRLERTAPKVGTDSDEVEMAGRKWRWAMEVMQTQVETIRRIDVTVSLAESKDQTLALVSGFYGTAIDQPGSTAMLWPGGQLPGGPGGPGGGGNPNDPNNPNPKNPTPGNPGDPPQTDPNPTVPGGESPPLENPSGGEPQ